MTRVLVFGAGAVGAIYLYFLHKGGAEVTAVCRSNYEAVQQNGFHIDSEIFGKVHFKPNVVRSASEAIGEWDFILICSKASAFANATADLIRPAVGSKTAIVLAQNGIGIEVEYKLAFLTNTIISGVVYLPTTQVRPGYIEMMKLERFEIGTYPHDASAMAKEQALHFQRLFEAGGATCVVHEDIQAKRWEKVMINASWNPICALTRLNDADFLRSSPLAESIGKDVSMEVVAVANAKGYANLTEEVVDHHLDRHRSRLQTGGKEPSMLTDVRFGRSIEVEAILGNTTRIARDVKVNTPKLDLLYALAKGLDYSIRQDQKLG